MSFSEAIPTLKTQLLSPHGSGTKERNSASSLQCEEVLLLWDSQFDPKENLLLEISSGAEYHSQVRKGQHVHPLRTSAFYAHGLIVRGDESSIIRAIGILERLIELQETDPRSPFFGIWGYHLEEPAEAMAPADFNWADFIGIHLLEIILGYRHRLPASLTLRLDETIRNAVLSIFRRNVHSAYTNIAIMGAAVTLLAGEHFGDDLWVEYGRNRLTGVRKLFEHNEGFNEYNSPTYSFTAMFELERILRLVSDETAKSDARILWRAVWEDLADSYHVPTGQFSGPQSRSYGNWLNEGQLRCLEQRLDARLPRCGDNEPITACAEELAAPGPLPCPEDLRNRFLVPPEAPIWRSRCKVRSKNGEPSLVSSCWMSPEATIGSISQEISWYQTRPVLAFWRTGNSGIARCRVRFLLNGKDFASGLMISNQVGPSVLTACQLIQGGGTYHPHFDAPADGVFLAHDLRLRIECEGTELVLKRLTSTSWWLGNSLGGMSMAFGPAQYDGEQRQTIAETHENGLSRLDLILHQGKTVQLAPENLRETMASVLIQWSTRPVPKPLPPIIALPSEDRIRLTWEQADVALALTLARHPKDRDALVALNVDSGFATKGSFQD